MMLKFGSFRAPDFAGLTMLVAVGCGSSGDPKAEVDTEADATADSESAEELGPAYVLAQEITTPEGSEMLISILDDVGPQEVDRGSALAVSGGARGVFSELGYVFVPNNEDFTLTRYEVSKDLDLVEPVVLSFGSFGLSMFGDFYVFGPERAYLTSRDGILVVWDPTGMEILEDVAIEGLERDDLLGTFPQGRDLSYAPREVANATGYLNLPVAWMDWDNVDAQPLMGMFSVSTTDASDQVLVTTGCSSVGIWALSGRDDKVYALGTPSWGPFYNHGATELPGSAFARFDTQTRTFDESACVEVEPMTGGDEAGIALQYAPGRFLLRTIDAATAEASSVDEYWSDIEFACSFYDGDIDETGTITLSETPSMGVDGGCYGGVFGVDGDAYFNIPAEGFESGALARWTGASMETVIGLDGYPWTFERIR